MDGWPDGSRKPTALREGLERGPWRVQKEVRFELEILHYYLRNQAVSLLLLGFAKCSGRSIVLGGVWEVASRPLLHPSGTCAHWGVRRDQAAERANVHENTPLSHFLTRWPGIWLTFVVPGHLIVHRKVVPGCPSRSTLACAGEAHRVGVAPRYTQYGMPGPPPR